MMNYSNSAKHPQQPSLDTLRSKGPLRKTFLDPELQPGIYAGINACRGIVYRPAPLPLPSTLQGRTTLRNYGFEILRWFSLSFHLFSPSSPHPLLFFGFDLTVSRRSLPREKISSRLADGNGRCMYRPGFRYLLTVSNMSLVPYRNRYTPVVPSQILIALIACAGARINEEFYAVTILKEILRMQYRNTWDVIHRSRPRIDFFSFLSLFLPLSSNLSNHRPKKIDNPRRCPRGTDDAFRSGGKKKERERADEQIKWSLIQISVVESETALAENPLWMKEY